MNKSSQKPYEIMDYNVNFCFFTVCSQVDAEEFAETKCQLTVFVQVFDWSKERLHLNNRASLLPLWLLFPNALI